MGVMTGRAGQAGQPAGRGLAATAALAATALLATAVLAGCGSSAARASTVLQAARAATVELSDGSRQDAVVGMTVPAGATVHTAAGGSAALVAAGRTVLLGQATAVTVVDGEHERLRSGLVMIDARRAPGLTLDAGAASVQTPSGGLARVERGALLRAASFRRTLTVRPSGRKAQAAVPQLYQVQVPDGGLPGAVSPLALTRDAWERRYALDLVTADLDLDALAQGLDRNPASTTAVLSVVPASFGSSVLAAPGEPRSESALAYVLAGPGRSGTADRYREVRRLRAEGGSWGVVAAIVGADVAGAAAALDAVLNELTGPAALAAGGLPPALGPGPLLGGGGGSSPQGPQPAPNPTPPAGGGPTSGPSPGPAPRPSSSPSADPVQDVITTVTGLLPSPRPVVVSPSPSPLVAVRLGSTSLTLG